MNNIAQTHLTVGELAARWAVSKTFVRRAIWRGELRATRFGRSVRIPVAEADRYALQRAGADIARQAVGHGGRHV